MFVIRCASCGESSGQVNDLGSVCAFVAAHARCETTSLPLTLAHEHRWLAVTPTDDPSIIVRDCGCGARQVVRTDLYGRTDVLPDSIVDGGSLANAIFQYVANRPIRDRWHAHQ